MTWDTHMQPSATDAPPSPPHVTTKPTEGDQSSRERLTEVEREVAWQRKRPLVNERSERP